MQPDQEMSPPGRDGRPAVPDTTLDPATVVCRPIRPDDAARLVRMFPRLSAETLYRRFFSPVVQPDLKRIRYLCEVDHDRREALVALVGDEVIGVARYDRAPDDPRQAEVAVLVEDAWQGHGVGRFLMQRLGERALAQGVTRFSADVLASNEAPVKLARAVAPLVEVSFADGETHLAIPLDTAAVPRRPRRDAARTAPVRTDRRLARSALS
jgi:RimJ/RimL family protein N-acetyltransferase